MLFTHRKWMGKESVRSILKSLKNKKSSFHALSLPKNGKRRAGRCVKGGKSMAGHSKWANIKHRKERADKKKGKIFSRIMKEIISAVKQGGPDLKSNSKLRIAIQKAKDANLPTDNIERNIKKAASADTSDYTEMTYELYGFGGVGLVVDIMTDNKNRIASEIRIAINKCGGTIATPGAVSYNFDRKGLIRVDKSTIDEDALFLLASD